MNPRLNEIRAIISKYDNFTKSLEAALKRFEDFYEHTSLTKEFIAGNQHAHRHMRCIARLENDDERKRQLGDYLNHKFRENIRSLDNVLASGSSTQLLIGVMHEHGMGVEESTDLALLIYKNAANETNIANYYLALLTAKLSPGYVQNPSDLELAFVAGLIEANGEKSKTTYNQDFLAISNEQYELAINNLIDSVAAGDIRALIYICYIFQNLSLKTGRIEWFNPAMTTAAKYIGTTPFDLSFILAPIIPQLSGNISFNDLKKVTEYLAGRVKVEHKAVKELLNLFSADDISLEVCYLAPYVNMELFQREAITNRFNITNIIRNLRIALMRAIGSKYNELKALMLNDNSLARFDSVLPHVDTTYIPLLTGLHAYFERLPPELSMNVLQQLIDGDYRIGLFIQLRYNVTKELNEKLLMNTPDNIMQKVRLDILSHKWKSPHSESICDSKLSIFARGKIWTKEVPASERRKWLITEDVKNGVVSLEEGQRAIERNSKICLKV